MGKRLTRHRSGHQWRQEERVVVHNAVVESHITDPH
jgi:hypothetical protein